MTAFTLFHVALSLVGIGAGLVFAAGLVRSKRQPGWTAVFLGCTVATSVTGFLFPFHKFLPSHGVGILSLLILPVVFFAFYSRRLAGAWRWIFVVGAMLALYFNFFVLIVQAFLKVPALHALAPTQAEPPFAIAQGVALLLFVGLTIVAVRRFRPSPVAAV